MATSARYFLGPSTARRSDASNRMMNGEVVYRYVMPTVQCACARRGGGVYGATSVPVAVPPGWETRPELQFAVRTARGRPPSLLSVADFRHFREGFIAAVLADPNRYPVDASLVERLVCPGMPLHPVAFKPGRGRLAICHSLTGWVVRRDLADLILEQGLSGIAFAPVETIQGAKSEYDFPHVLNESDVPEGVVRTICPDCGSFIDDTRDRRWRLSAAAVAHADFQILATTSRVLVSERAKAVLEGFAGLNSAFEPIEVV